ncbi:MAG: MBL fold metallo-hydrolase [Vicinamibacterales bacterium]
MTPKSMIFATVRVGLATLLLIVASSPASAQIDFSGEWGQRVHEDQPDRAPGPAVGDYMGLPINDAGRRKADSWDAAILSSREHQGKPHPSTYSQRGPSNIRISKMVNPVTQEIVAFEMYGTFGRATRTIWLDGRAHPSESAPHTWAGFSTGRWEGQMLTVRTTHIKMGWLQRNGVAHSDQATMIEHWFRYENNLMIVSFVDDPIYLAEPLIRTTNWVLELGQQLAPTYFEVVDEVANRAPGWVPHYLPGANPSLAEQTRKHGIPLEAVRGGVATLDPEYQFRVRQLALMAPITSVPSAIPATTLVASAKRDRPPADLELLPVQGNVYLVAGAGGNVTVQVGDIGVVVVDTGASAKAGALLDAITKRFGKPVRYIINTQPDADHVGGNEVIGKAGNTIRSGNGVTTAGRAPGVDPGAEIIAHENVVTRMISPGGGAAPWPTAAQPGSTYFALDKELFLNGEAIQILHSPAAHTDGDSLVFFRRSDVISAGDILDLTAYPRFDSALGGSLTGIIAGLNQIIALAIPRDMEEGGTYIIPGHGRICDEADVAEYRDMITVIRDRIEDMVAKRMTLEQVKAARPTFEYDARYGATSGPWTTNTFVEESYRELAARVVKPQQAIPRKK